MLQLKLSKKIQSLIGLNTTAGDRLHSKVSEQLRHGAEDKAGAVQIMADDEEVAYLSFTAGQRIGTLDSLLQAATTDEERKPYFGEHSAWRALMKQIEPPAA